MSGWVIITTRDVVQMEILDLDSNDQQVNANP